MSQEASSPTAPEHPVDAAQRKREQELQRALTTFKDGRINEAIGICRDLLAKTPDLARALGLLGGILGYAGQVDEGISP